MKGQVALSTVLLIASVIAEIGVGLAFIFFLILNSGLGGRLSTEALAASQAGLQDAFVKIVRDKNFSSAGYDLTVGSRTTRVTVTKDSPAVGKTAIVSVGAASFRQRKLQAIVVVNSNTGKVDLESVAEIAL